MVHPQAMESIHGYTRVESPWIIGEYKSIYGKLIHYISGGGMTTFGRTVAQEVVRRKHRQFYFWAALLAVVWLYYYFVD